MATTCPNCSSAGPCALHSAEYRFGDFLTIEYGGKPADLLTPTERENVEGLRHDLRPGHRRGASADDARDLLAILDRIAPPKGQ